jgi:hypothetical protein
MVSYECVVRGMEQNYHDVTLSGCMGETCQDNSMGQPPRRIRAYLSGCDTATNQIM